MKRVILIFIIALISYKIESQNKFSEKALNDTIITLKGEKLLFKKILNKHKGKKILIDIWASWCKDCIEGIPKVAALQHNNKGVVFIFLSLDKNNEDWKAGVEKYNIKGEHYFLSSGWKGDFGTFLNLNWIPRYIVVNEKSEIVLFKAIKADDKNIIKALK